jgi:hypothetical protein
MVWAYLAARNTVSTVKVARPMSTPPQTLAIAAHYAAVEHWRGSKLLAGLFTRRSLTCRA